MNTFRVTYRNLKTDRIHEELFTCDCNSRKDAAWWFKWKRDEKQPSSLWPISGDAQRGFIRIIGIQRKDKNTKGYSLAFKSIFNK